MRNGARPLHLCNCNGSIPIDVSRLPALASGTPVRTALCRSELGAFEASLAPGAHPIVACTQEAALFAEVAEAAGVAVQCFNIREQAGWSEEGAAAMPKIAALIAEAMLPGPEPVPSVSLSAGNRLLIIGEAGVALAWAERLAGRFAVSVLITSSTPGAALPVARDFPVWSGGALRIAGHLGAFALDWQQLNPIDLDLCVRCNACVKACPEGAIGFDYQVDAGRCTGHRACVASCTVTGAIDFARTDVARSAQFDLVLDLGATPLWSGFELPQGYAAPGRDPLDQALAVQALGDWVGQFEKPRYVALEPRLCAHSRARKSGCTNCIDVCATRAIGSAGDHVAIDPYLCQGCGTCSSVCPTGAIALQYPRLADIGARVRAVLAAFRDAGGEAPMLPPMLLFHAETAGRGVIDELARRGRGLPARTIPLASWSSDAIGPELLLAAIALGACQVAVLTVGEAESGADDAPLRAQAAWVQTILSGLGYGGEHVRIVRCADRNDWKTLESALWDWSPAVGVTRPAGFQLAARKRDTLDLAIRHLADQAPAPVVEIALNAGAPFGAIAVSEACTVCMACVGACPASALSAAPDAYRLDFLERNCVQCGLCEASCPERAITLVPRLRLDDSARRSRPLREAETFCCEACGKAMGAKPIIEAMFARLSGHAMFASETERRRLKLCADCRVIDMMKTEVGTASGRKAWDITE